METADQEAARVRAEVAQELEAEDQGEAPGVDESKEEPAKETTPEDPWEGVNPALKRSFDEMSQRVSSLTATELRLKQAESRIGAITNELSAARKAAETTREAPTKEQMAAAAESDEKWENLKKDFPEWAEAFDGRFDRKLNETVTSLKKDIEELRQQGSSEGKSEIDIALEVEKRLLSFSHPKWKEDIASTDWQQWLAKQPADKQKLVESQSARDAADLLDAFYEETRGQKSASQVAEERRKRLKTGALPEGRKATPVKSEADMTASELRANIGKEIFAE